MNLYESLTLAVLSVTAAIFLYQARIAVRSLRTDHDRRRKEATIHYMNQIRPVYRTMNHRLIEKLGSGPIDDKAVEAIIRDSELHSSLKEMLGLFEHLAVGANCEVFDTVLLNRMSGNYLIRVFDRYECYFKRQRFSTNNPHLYDEFEVLKRKLVALRS